MTEYLSLDDLITLGTKAFGGPPPIRDIGLLGSAVARPQTTVFGADAYPDVWTKAAALLHSLVKNHALVDGNKRLAWVATTTFLALNDVDVSIRNDAAFRLVLEVAAGERTEVNEIASVLCSLNDL